MAERTAFVPPARRAVADARLQRPNWALAAPRDPRLLWLDKNENTDPAFLAVVARLVAEMDPKTAAIYPDTAPLYRALAARLRVPPDALIVASGSDGVIGAVFRTFVDAGDDVLITSPSYAMYQVYCDIQGAKTTRLEYQPSEAGPRLDPETVRAALRERRPKLLCLPNPDSPTGTVFAPEVLRGLLRAALDAGAMVLVDEAYHPFYEETALPWLGEFPNLVVGRSFSKAWGLTGLRLGYGVSSPEVAALMQKVRPNYDANSVAAVLAARMAAEHEREMLESVARLRRGLTSFTAAMRGLGLRALDCGGNFCHVAFGPHAPRVHAALADLVLYRKDQDAPCLKGFSRFSATTEELYRPVVERIRGVVRP